MIYVQWDRPRHWRVRLYGPISVKSMSGRFHKSVGVIALDASRAIEGAQSLHPDYRIDSVHDMGDVTLVVDTPAPPLSE